MTWTEEIVKALTHLGGYSRYDDLYEYFKKYNIKDYNQKRSGDATIREAIESHSSAASRFNSKPSSYKNNPKNDIFIPMGALGDGYWGLRSIINPINLDLLSNIPIDIKDVCDDNVIYKKHDAPNKKIAKDKNELKSDSYTKISKVNYEEANKRRSSLGFIGEKIVLDIEKKKLIDAGKSNLCESIEHTSQERGDGAGYDIRSFDENGNTIFIEVKTTSKDKTYPFFMSKNEVDFSRKHSSSYLIYRLYNISKTKNKEIDYYLIKGNVNERLNLKPIEYKVDF
ncbi:DUF3883 domain-containing protein [Apilactobacillus ozensis]|uniref:DUF3883 domain-containing protein n=1 Tax=Apilactobacillus ozensis TaxID=866801 RepID=UPI00200B4B29|nr:DUF3883 domain-containing protein [Apilactobacillus ozensis]MCK8606984.1 DUF3883 domain-containing protein [Apilactobacillus ozensis]